jgi:hypothetical protein
LCDISQIESNIVRADVFFQLTFAKFVRVLKPLLITLKNEFMQLNIFFSHAWADKESATLKFLQNRLNEQYNVWIDTREIAIGESIRPEIPEGIRKCDVYLIVWSKSAEMSNAVQYELQTAAELGKRIIVCAIDQHPPAWSPYIGGLECISFSGAALADEAEWNRLNDLLRSIAAERTDAQEDEPGLLAAANAELEDLIRRYRENLGANDGSDPYIAGALDDFVKLFGSEEDQKMRLFAEAARAISAAYPFGKDDQRKQLLLLRAIMNIDPEHSEPELQELREFLERQYALDLQELHEERRKARVSEQQAGSMDSPVARDVFQRLAGRKLLAMQSSNSGSGDSYANSSDVVHLQLFADGKCRFRLVRSNYANHFGMIRDEKEEEGTWNVLEDNGKLFLYFDWMNNSPERLELVLEGPNEVLLNKVRYGIVDLEYEV